MALGAGGFSPYLGNSVCRLVHGWVLIGADGLPGKEGLQGLMEAGFFSRLLAELASSWEGCQKYFYRAVARHARLSAALAAPSKVENSSGAALSAAVLGRRLGPGSSLKCL